MEDGREEVGYRDVPVANYSWTPSSLSSRQQNYDVWVWVKGDRRGGEGEGLLKGGHFLFILAG